MTQNELETLERNRNKILRLKAQLLTQSEPVSAVPITGIPSSGNGKNAVERIVEQKETIRTEIITVQQESRRICFQIEPPRTRRIFVLHYAEGLSWSKVADKMGYLDGSTPRKMKIEYIRRNIH